MKKHDRIISEAASWAIRVEAGLDGAGQDAFLDWLAADRRHGAEYERQRANWARLDILADWRPEHAMLPNRDLLAPASARETILEWARAHWRALAGGALGATAAAIACVALLVSGPFTTPPSAGDAIAANDAAAKGSKDATISTIEQSTLDDGTTVELNRGASITVDYTPELRLVKLNHGEANFSVVKDPSRPFVVEVDGVRLRAPGTSFNVRRDGGGSVEVLVTSGSVRVNAEAGKQQQIDVPRVPRETAFVNAGQMAVVTKTESATSCNVQTLAPDKIENITAWYPRMLDIEGQSLSSVVEEFNKCNAPLRLVIMDPELENEKVSAVLRSDQVENLLRVLEGSLRVKAERVGDTVTLRRISRT